MKAIPLLVLLVLMVPVPLWAQCRCDFYSCSTRCPGGEKTFAFTIPIGSLLEIIRLLGIRIPLPPLTTLVIPDVEVQLSTTFSGNAFVGCPEGCCPSDRPLTMSADLFLIGRAEVESLPPSIAGFSTFVPVVQSVTDQRPEDLDPAPCRIGAEWSFTERYTRVSLTWSIAGGILALPIVDTKGEGKSECIVYCGCLGFNGPPTITSWPQEVVVPIGGSVEFPVEAWDIEGDPLSFSAASRIQGVTIRFVEVEDLGLGKKRAKGVIETPLTVSEGVEETTVVVCDPYGLCDAKPLHIRYVANHPPKAQSYTLTVSHNDLINQRNISIALKAEDEDLKEDLKTDPPNHGYLYWFVWNSPFFTPKIGTARVGLKGSLGSRLVTTVPGRIPSSISYVGPPTSRR